MKKTLLLVCALALCLTGSAQAINYVGLDQIAWYPCPGGDGEGQYNSTAAAHPTNKLEQSVGDSWPSSQYNPIIPPAADYPMVQLYDPDVDYQYPCTSPDILRMPAHDPCHWIGSSWTTGLDINSQSYRLVTAHGNDDGTGAAWQTITRLDASGQKYKGHNPRAHAAGWTSGDAVWASDNDPCADHIQTVPWGIRRVDYNNNEVWTHLNTDAGAPAGWLPYASSDMEIGPDGLLYIMHGNKVTKMDHTLADPAARIASASIVLDESSWLTNQSSGFYDMDIGADGKIYIAHDYYSWMEDGGADPNRDEVRIYNADGSLDQVIDKNTFASWPWDSGSTHMQLITVDPAGNIYLNKRGATGELWRIEIPEPTTMLLLGLGSVALLRRKRS